MSHIVDHKLTSSGSASIASLAEFFDTRAKEMDPHSASYQGFTIVGPALLAFFDWVYDEIESKKVDHVLFSSENILNHYRGYLGHKAVSLGISSNASAIFLEKSSQKIFLAGVSEHNFADFFRNIVELIDKFSLPSVLDSFGIDTPASYVLNEIGLKNSEYNHTRDLHATELFLQAWRSQIVKSARHERRDLLQRLLSLGIKEGQRVAIVDHGFDGFLQEAFENAVKDKIGLDVYGYSFVLNGSPDSKRRMNSIRMNGFLDSRNTPIDTLNSIERGIKIFDSIWENDRPYYLKIPNSNQSKFRPSKAMDEGIANFLRNFVEQQQGRSSRRMMSELTKPLVSHLTTK